MSSPASEAAVSRGALYSFCEDRGAFLLPRLDLGASKRATGTPNDRVATDRVLFSPGLIRACHCRLAL